MTWQDLSLRHKSLSLLIEYNNDILPSTLKERWANFYGKQKIGYAIGLSGEKSVGLGMGTLLQLPDI